MPSAKAARQSLKRRARNQPLRTKAKTYITRTRKAIAANELDEAEEAVRRAASALDKAAQKGAIHPNNAARRKSRIMKQLQKARSGA